MFLNHDSQINYQNMWYNSDCFNQQNYVDYQMQMQVYQTQMQAYQNYQNQQIYNAAKAFGDYIDAVKQVDSNHQFELFLACLSVFGTKMGWNGIR